MINAERHPNDILTERLVIIQKLSAVTAEHLRLTQARAGFQVLDMQANAAGVSDQLAGAEAALSDCEARLQALEGQLARLDEELERASGGMTP